MEKKITSVFEGMYEGILTQQGSFDKSIYDCFMKASLENRIRLYDAFPEFFGDFALNNFMSSYKPIDKENIVSAIAHVLHNVALYMESFQSDIVLDEPRITKRVLDGGTAICYFNRNHFDFREDGTKRFDNDLFRLEIVTIYGVTHFNFFRLYDDEYDSYLEKELESKLMKFVIKDVAVIFK